MNANNQNGRRRSGKLMQVARVLATLAVAALSAGVGSELLAAGNVVAPQPRAIGGEAGRSVSAAGAAAYR